MKRSLEEALEEARKHSLSNPGTRVYVMDKKRRKPAVVTLEWIFRERFLEGYGPVAVYLDGEVVGR